MGNETTRSSSDLVSTEAGHPAILSVFPSLTYQHKHTYSKGEIRHAINLRKEKMHQIYFLAKLEINFLSSHCV